MPWIDSDDLLKDVPAIDPERVDKVLDEQGYPTIKDAAIAAASSAARVLYNSYTHRIVEGLQ